MADTLAEKTDQYERLLASGLASTSVAPRSGSPLASLGNQYVEMAESYLADGRHFKAEADLTNALAAFSYGHGWLDAGVRAGLLDVPADAEAFAI